MKRKTDEARARDMTRCEVCGCTDEDGLYTAASPHDGEMIGPMCPPCMMSEIVNTRADQRRRDRAGGGEGGA